MFEPIDRAARSRPYAFACLLHTVLFAASALGSAIPFPIQAAILAPMVTVSWRLHRGAVVPKLRLGKLLAWLGAGFVGLALALLGCVLVIPLALVSGFTLTMALYHQREWWLFP
jgi:hypothetical protein